MAMTWWSIGGVASTELMPNSRSKKSERTMKMKKEEEEEEEEDTRIPH